MTNEEKYKTPAEREKAFAEYCQKEICWRSCFYPRHQCLLRWLALEVEEEKPLPCPFCGDETWVGCATRNGLVYRSVACRCGYTSICHIKDSDAVACHNELCRRLKGEGK